jgi:hypothetical protein
MFSFFIIIIITFLCPFVSALLPDDDHSDESFSGYFDFLIGSTVPFIAYIIVEYSSVDVAQLVRSLVYLIIVGVQQELAFTFSSVEVSNFIKILQHILVALLLFGIIGEFLLTFKSGKIVRNSLKEESYTRDSLNNEEKSLAHERNIEPEILIDSYMHDGQSEEKENVLKEKGSIHEQEIERPLKKVEPKILISSISDKYVQEKERPLKKTEPQMLISSTANSYMHDKIIVSTKKPASTADSYMHDKQSEEKENVLKEKGSIHEQEIERPLIKAEPEILISSISDNYVQEKERPLKKTEPQMLISSTGDEIYVENSKKKRNNKIFYTIFLVDYLALILFIVLLGLWLNDLRNFITLKFILTLVISFSITFIIQSLILIVANSKGKLQKFIDRHNQIYDPLFPGGYHAQITIIVDIIIPHLLYFPSLINYFLLQTPDIFNKIFGNLTTLLISSWIVLIYKILMDDKEEEEGGEEDTYE